MGKSEAAKKAWRTRRKGKSRQTGRVSQKMKPTDKAILTIKYKRGLGPLERARGRKVKAPKIKGKVREEVVKLNGKGRYIHQWYVSSKTDPSKVYKVSQAQQGHYLCSCPAFSFQKGPIAKHKPCKHILSVR